MQSNKADKKGVKYIVLAKDILKDISGVQEKK